MAAGAVIVGKANLHEFAWGVTSQNPWYGTVQNPAHPGRTTGGSSGGNAAALAAGLCDLGLATDTGCSIRLPAACCELVGLKPSWGRIPLEGVYPLCPTFDTVGPMARTVEDVALAWSVLAGAPVPEPRLRGLTVGVLTRPPSVGGAGSCRRTARPSSTSTGSSSSAPASSRPSVPEPEDDTWPLSTTRPRESHRRRSRAGRRLRRERARRSWSTRRRVDPAAVARAREAIRRWREYQPAGRSLRRARARRRPAARRLRRARGADPADGVPAPVQPARLGGARDRRPPARRTARRGGARRRAQPGSAARRALHATPRVRKDSSRARDADQSRQHLGPGPRGVGSLLRGGLRPRAPADAHVRQSRRSGSGSATASSTSSSGARPTHRSSTISAWRSTTSRRSTSG